MRRFLYLIVSCLLLGTSESSAEILYSVTDLGTLGGSSSTAESINDAGQVVGWSTISSVSLSHAFLYSEGKMIDLGPGRAFGINNAGQVVGDTGGFFGHAVLYSNGQMKDLTIPGQIASEGIAINNLSQVVGSFLESASRGPLPFHAFVYTNGQMSELGMLPGTYSSQGLAINDAGQVVGTYLLRGGNFGDRAFLYSNGQMLDLTNLIDPTLGIILSQANGINNNGQIVANTSGRAYLLTPTATPVPEPSTLALFGVALLGLGAWVNKTRL